MRDFADLQYNSRMLWRKKLRSEKLQAAAHKECQPSSADADQKESLAIFAFQERVYKLN
jgi:hypothetical protein